MGKTHKEHPTKKLLMQGLRARGHQSHKFKDVQWLVCVHCEGAGRIGDESQGTECQFCMGEGSYLKTVPIKGD